MSYLISPIDKARLEAVRKRYDHGADYDRRGRLMMAERTEGAQQHTVSQVFGEVVWLLSQSTPHRSLTIGDLEWLVMPPILNRQFYIFRRGDRPIGAALWASLNVEDEERLKKSVSSLRFELAGEFWNSGDRLWLIALIAPFADSENNEAELMIADLIAGPFAEKSFGIVHTDPSSGTRSILQVSADAKEKLVEQTRERLLNKGLGQ